MILVIRISGMIKIPVSVQETLFRLKIRRKYCAVLLNETPENQKILKSIRNYVAYGKINDKMLVKLIEARAKPIDKKQAIDVKQIISELSKKKLNKLGIKPFFRLHPPRKGIESKKHFGVGKGVLGDNKEKINDLL